MRKNRIRLIPRLDIKNDTVVKGIAFEGLRVVGKPEDLADLYYRQGADELVYIDAVASLYERNCMSNLIRQAAKRIFVPLTVGGGIRKLDDIAEILNAGADKVAINTAAIRNPELLRTAAYNYGSQCIVLSVQAKRRRDGSWEAYTERGREPTGRDVLAWIREAIDLGVGEVLLTSVDKDGTRSGLDLPLIEAVGPICSVPLIVSGGVGNLDQLSQVAQAPYKIDGISLGSLLHYKKTDIGTIKRNMDAAGIPVRHTHEHYAG